MKTVTVLLMLFLSGCASLEYAGVAKYTVKPFRNDAGELLCCEVVVANGKEIGLLKTRIEKRGGDWLIELEETSVYAFEGQKIAATAASTVAKTAAAAAATAITAPIVLPVAGALTQKAVQ